MKLLFERQRPPLITYLAAFAAIGLLALLVVWVGIEAAVVIIVACVMFGLNWKLRRGTEWEPLTELDLSEPTPRPKGQTSRSNDARQIAESVRASSEAEPILPDPLHQPPATIQSWHIAILLAFVVGFWAVTPLSAFVRPESDWFAFYGYVTLSGILAGGFWAYFYHPPELAGDALEQPSLFHGGLVAAVMLWGAWWYWAYARPASGVFSGIAEWNPLTLIGMVVLDLLDRRSSLFEAPAESWIFLATGACSIIGTWLGHRLIWYVIKQKPELASPSLKPYAYAKLARAHRVWVSRMYRRQD